jgi:hypothetical protein
MLKGLTETDIDILKAIVELSENEERTIFQDKMTSGIFFDCCKMGYDANSYTYDKELTHIAARHVTNFLKSAISNFSNSDLCTTNFRLE